ncbi:MAG: hypothetical protein J2P38_00350, partial [Candidatus Dormibacteraeota bacterium]|nr:hypothetical protein [Candidatus Dormibacteraeota bacterium]
VVSEGGPAEGLAPPPWDWSTASAGELQENWRDLAVWVEWLRRGFSDWVVLPDCWARHEPLRSELCAFMWWHRRAQRASDDPEDLIRWHGELRRSAEFWTRLATCDHGAPDGRLQQDEQARRQRLAGHLRRAMQD